MACCSLPGGTPTAAAGRPKPSSKSARRLTHSRRPDSLTAPTAQTHDTKTSTAPHSLHSTQRHHFSKSHPAVTPTGRMHTRACPEVTLYLPSHMHEREWSLFLLAGLAGGIWQAVSHSVIHVKSIEGSVGCHSWHALAIGQACC